MSVLPCLCCHGKRVVPDAEGNPRPCSRCNTAAFFTWAEARRPNVRAIDREGRDQARKELGGG